jgi:HopA1 effector protein family
MSEAHRVACAKIFHTVEILAPGRVRIGDGVVECNPNTLLAFLQTEIYCRSYACFRDVPVARPVDALLAALRSANNARGIPKESLAGVPHTYTALSGSLSPGATWLRLYWNVGPKGAVVLMDRATNLLVEGDVPFRLKVMLDTARRRRDGAVLYVPTGRWQAAERLLRMSHSAVVQAGDIEPEVPLFARGLRAGVGLAEDPGGGHSFGTHRALLVALALADIHLSGLRGEEDWWRALRVRFEAFGLRLERPHLNGLGPDPYVM